MVSPLIDHVLNLNGSLGNDMQVASSHLDVASTNAQEEESPSRSLTPVFQSEEDMIQGKIRLLINVVHNVLDNGSLDGRMFTRYHNDAIFVCNGRRRDISSLATLVAEAITQNFQRCFVVKLRQLIDDKAPQDEVATEFVRFFDRIRELSRIFMTLEQYLMYHPKRVTIFKLAGKLIARNLLLDLGSPLEAYIWDALKMRAEDGNRVSNYNMWCKIIERAAPFLKRNPFAQIPQQMVNTYDALAHAWIQDPSRYISRVTSFTSSEMSSASDHLKLPQKSRLKLLESIRWIFLYRDFSSVLEQCMSHLVSSNESSEIWNIYEGAKEVDRMLSLNNVKILRHYWKKSISQLILARIESSQASNEDLVCSLCNVYNDYNWVSKPEFDEGFRQSLSNAFREQFNDFKFNSTILSCLCKYCDQYFKSYRKKQTVDTQVQFSAMRSNVLFVFDCLANKDDFLTMYKRDLSRRLLFRRGTVPPQEKDIVEEFATLIGANNVVIQSIHTMFSDMLISLSLDGESNCTSALVTMNVLDSRCWPEIPKMNTDLQLPVDMQRSLDLLKHQYRLQSRRNTNQILDWTHYGLHQLELEGCFGLERKTLVVNLLQATVLLQFKEGDRFTVQELHHQTAIEPSLLIKILYSLSQEKVAILLLDEDLYCINEGFSCKQSIIKVPFVKEKETQARSREEITMERNRQDEFRSQIVKLMKDARELPLATIVDRTIQVCQSRGPVRAHDLEQAVEYLLKNEYLQKVDSDVIKYLP